MELRQLRHFVAVAEEGNISRAAKRIFLTQPALSRQIKSLEQELGQCLLERQAHSIRLTAAGELLLHEARDLLQHAAQVEARVRDAGRGVRLRVGYAPSLAGGILSVAVENFTQAHANAHVELFDLATKEMLSGLEDDTLDVAVTVRQLPEPRGLAWVPLAQATWQLAMGRSHPLARQKSIHPEDMNGERLLVFCERDYPEYSDTVGRWLRTHRVRARITGEYDGVDSLMAAVESGLGVAMVTTRTAERVPRRVRLKPLASGPGPVCIAAACAEARAAEKPLAVFIEELRKAASALA